jgi:hypothetical protein
MESALDRMMRERREWRERNADFFRICAHRDIKVSERCEAGWKNFSNALHREIVRQNSLGKPKLAMERPDGSFEVQRMGKLSSLLMIGVDRQNARIRYRSLMHEGSAIIRQEGEMEAAFWGSLLLVDPDGRMLRLSYEKAAQFLLQPIVES